METDRTGWAEVIRRRRDAFKMTQDQLARAAGVSLKTVSNIENESLTPQRGTLRKIREALGLSSDLAVAQVQAQATVLTSEELKLGPRIMGDVDALDALEDWLNKGRLGEGPPPGEALWIFDDTQLVEELHRRLERRARRIRDLNGVTAMIERGKQPSGPASTLLAADSGDGEQERGEGTEG